MSPSQLIVQQIITPQSWQGSESSSISKWDT